MKTITSALSLWSRALTVGALCACMANTGHSANIYLAFGFEPIAVTNGTIVQGSLPTSFTNDGIARHGATAVNGAVPYQIRLLPGAGSTITMNLVVLIADNDNNHANDGMTVSMVSMDSKAPSSGLNAKGDFTFRSLNPAMAGGLYSSIGTAVDTDGDGDLDVGRNHAPSGNATEPGPSFSNISSLAPAPFFPDLGNTQPPGTGFTKLILGTVTWTLSATSAIGATTNLELFPFVPTAKVYSFTADGINNPNFGGAPANTAPFGFETWQASAPRRLYWLNGGLVPTTSSVSSPLVETNPGILVTVVPEPDTMTLLCFGCLGFVGYFGRRRTQ